jgi:hypothetical protein
MTAVLWCIGSAVLLVAIVDIAVHVDILRTAHRAKQVQNDLNRPGR